MYVSVPGVNERNVQNCVNEARDPLRRLAADTRIRSSNDGVHVGTAPSYSKERTGQYDVNTWKIVSINHRYHLRAISDNYVILVSFTKDPQVDFTLRPRDS